MNFLQPLLLIWPWRSRPPMRTHKRVRAISGSWLRIAALVLTISATAGAYADPRPSNITNETGPPGHITLGCVVKGGAVTVYYPGEKAAIMNFPNGFEKRTYKIGQEITPGHSLIVEELLWIDGRQILRGHLVDGRGWTVADTVYVYPEDWDCSLHVNPSK